MKKLLFALLALLLSGCQSPKDKASSLDCFVPRNDGETASTDSLEKDSIRKFYERMELWNALHGGRSKWESDK
jgi:hypothetical protein